MPPPSRLRAEPPQLVSYFAYSGGYHWHWKQTSDSFPGQPVVLVHGLVVTATTLLPLARVITHWAPVLVPDLPGFGLTTGRRASPDIGELAAALDDWMRIAGVEAGHIVGNSFGSQVAAELAARFPKRVLSLTLIGPTIDPTARDLRSQASRLFADLPHEPLNLWTGAMSIRSTLRTFRFLQGDQIETKLPLIRVPSLVLRGLSDPIAPESWTIQAARLLPDAASVSLANGGHCVHYSHPGLVASALRTFTFPFRHQGTQAVQGIQGTPESVNGPTPAS